MPLGVTSEKIKCTLCTKQLFESVAAAAGHTLERGTAQQADHGQCMSGVWGVLVHAHVDNRQTLLSLLWFRGAHAVTLQTQQQTFCGKSLILVGLSSERPSRQLRRRASQLRLFTECTHLISQALASQPTFIKCACHRQGCADYSPCRQRRQEAQHTPCRRSPAAV